MAEAAQVAVDAGQDAGRQGSGNLGDRVFGGTLWVLGGMILAVALLIVLNLTLLARPLAKDHTLWGFITTSEPSPSSTARS